MYFLLAFLLARYSPFYLCLFLFSFAFHSPCSAYFGVLSNFFARFSRLAFRHLLIAFYMRLRCARCARCELRYKYFGIFDNVVFIVIPVQNLSFSSLQEYRSVISYVLCANAVKMREAMKIIMILNIISLTVCIWLFFFRISFKRTWVFISGQLEHIRSNMSDNFN